MQFRRAQTSLELPFLKFLRILLPMCRPLRTKRRAARLQKHQWQSLLTIQLPLLKTTKDRKISQWFTKSLTYRHCLTFKRPKALKRPKSWISIGPTANIKWQRIWTLKIPALVKSQILWSKPQTRFTMLIQATRWLSIVLTCKSLMNTTLKGKKKKAGSVNLALSQTKKSAYVDLSIASRGQVKR